MAGTAVRGRLTWQVATVSEVRQETPSVRTITLAVPAWAGHRAGQHLDVRLTADDGYSAERSYSIASAPGEAVAITVERLDDGEVSPYLTEELTAGDELELRGPIGGYFVWDGGRAGGGGDGSGERDGGHGGESGGGESGGGGGGVGGPLLLLAGGSGVVPFRSMLRHHARTGSTVPARLLYSARSLPDVIYRDELDHCDGVVQVIYALTRHQPPGWSGLARRVDAGLLAEVAWAAGQHPLGYVCGPTSFVEAAADALVGLGYPPDRVKTERFGATGVP